MLNIQDKENLKSILSQLDATRTPVFGKMGPQHMVEHLIILFHLAVSNTQGEITTPLEKLPIMQRFLHSDREFVAGIKAPFIPEGLIPLNFPDLKASINALFVGLDKFNAHYKANPESRAVHPVFGNLNYEEWIIFHNKHFTHHFKQFELI